MSPALTLSKCVVAPDRGSEQDGGHHDPELAAGDAAALGGLPGSGRAARGRGGGDHGRGARDASELRSASQGVARAGVPPRFGASASVAAGSVRSGSRVGREPAPTPARRAAGTVLAPQWPSGRRRPLERPLSSSRAQLGRRPEATRRGPGEALVVGLGRELTRRALVPERGSAQERPGSAEGENSGASRRGGPRELRGAETTPAGATRVRRCRRRAQLGRRPEARLSRRDPTASRAQSRCRVERWRRERVDAPWSERRAIGSRVRTPACSTRGGPRSVELAAQRPNPAGAPPRRWTLVGVSGADWPAPRGRRRRRDPRRRLGGARGPSRVDRAENSTSRPELRAGSERARRLPRDENSRASSARRAAGTVLAAQRRAAGRHGSATGRRAPERCSGATRGETRAGASRRRVYSVLAARSWTASRLWRRLARGQQRRHFAARPAARPSAGQQSITASRRGRRRRQAAGLRALTASTFRAATTEPGARGAPGWSPRLLRWAPRGLDVPLNDEGAAGRSSGLSKSGTAVSLRPGRGASESAGDMRRGPGVALPATARGRDHWVDHGFVLPPLRRRPTRHARARSCPWSDAAALLHVGAQRPALQPRTLGRRRR